MKQRKFVNKEAVPKQAIKQKRFHETAKVCEQRGSSKASVKQKRFHEHCCSGRQNGIEDWIIILIDNADTLTELRRKGLYCMYKLKTYVRHGLNERDVYEVF